MAKVQVWLRPDQVDLLRTLLRTDLDIISERSLASKLEYALVRFSARRIDELLALLPPPQSAPRLVEDKAATG
jgi:hypothetical protein